MFCCGFNTFLHRENTVLMAQFYNTSQAGRKLFGANLSFCDSLSCLWLVPDLCDLLKDKHSQFLMCNVNVNEEEFCVHWRIILIITSLNLLSQQLDIEILLRYNLRSSAGLEINKLIYVLWRHSIIISNLKLKKLMHWRLKEKIIVFQVYCDLNFTSSIWTCRISCIQN